MSEQRDNSALEGLTARTQASIANDMRYAYETGNEDAETLAETPNLRPEDMKGGSDLADDPFDPLRYTGEWHPANEPPPNENNYIISWHNGRRIESEKAKQCCRYWLTDYTMLEAKDVLLWTDIPQPPHTDGGE